MRRRPNNLLILSLLAVACTVIVLTMTAVPVLRAAGALPLILFLPGYALTACLPQRTFSRGARVAVSLALSVALTILLSLILYWLRLSLQTLTWTIALTAVTLIVSVIAGRRQSIVKDEEAQLNLSLGLSGRNFMLLGLAAIIGVVAIGVARLPAPTEHVAGYTLLWMVPTRSDQNRNYDLGITSQEFDPVSYRLQVVAEGRVLQEWPELKLAPGETWTGSIALPADRVNTGSIEALLYRLDQAPAIYRQVKLHPPE